MPRDNLKPVEFFQTRAKNQSSLSAMLYESSGQCGHYDMRTHKSKNYGQNLV